MRGSGPPGSKPMLSPLHQLPGRLNGGWFQLTQVTGSEKTAILEFLQKPTTYTSSFLVGSVQILQEAGTKMRRDLQGTSWGDAYTGQRWRGQEEAGRACRCDTCGRRVRKRVK